MRLLVAHGLNLGELLNKEGKRYVEELERRDVISEATTQQTDGVGYMVFTQEQVDKTGVFNANKTI